MNRRFALTPIAALTLALGTTIGAAQAAGTGSAAAGSDNKATTQAGSSATGTAASGNRGSSSTMSSPARSGAASASSQNWERTHRASKIIGMDVVNRQGEKVGDVEDIVLDQQGNVAYAVVSTGGFLGMGEKLHAVPWRSLQTNTGSDSFLLDVDKERLRGAPAFDQNNFPNVNDPKWSSENRKHFPQASNTRSAGAQPADRATTGTKNYGTDVDKERMTPGGPAPSTSGTGTKQTDRATTGTPPYGTDVSKERMKPGDTAPATSGTDTKPIDRATTGTPAYGTDVSKERMKPDSGSSGSAGSTGGTK